MDLLLVRLAGSRPPGVDTLRAALQRQPWLTPEPGRRGVWARAFVFPGGQVQALRRLPDQPRYQAPGLLATLTPDADFAIVAPRLVALAGELQLGIDTPRSSGSLWWEAPDPSALEPRHLERAVAASRHCESREAWPLLGFVLAGAECLELAESHPALALLLASTARRPEEGPPALTEDELHRLVFRAGAYAAEVLLRAVPGADVSLKNSELVLTLPSTMLPGLKFEAYPRLRVAKVLRGEEALLDWAVFFLAVTVEASAGPES